MDRLDAMRLFVAIVERRSFTLAAQDCGVPRSTATEALKELERRLGVRLLERTTRQVRPTLDGEAYHQRCLAILASVEDAESFGGEPHGLLRVEAHGTLARAFLLPRLPEFLERHPQLRLQLSEGDRFIDPVREGVDCVVRVGTLPDSAMVARRIGTLREVTVASPAYLERRGTPTGLADLDGHMCVGFLSSGTGAIMPFEFVVDGAVREVALPATLTVTAAESLVMAARLGLGLIQAPAYHLEEDLSSGRLCTVLSDIAPTTTPVSLLYPQGRQVSPRVRASAAWAATLF